MSDSYTLTLRFTSVVLSDTEVVRIVHVDWQNQTYSQMITWRESGTADRPDAYDPVLALRVIDLMNSKGVLRDRMEKTDNDH